MKKHLTTIILVLILLVGAGLLGYPTFSDWWNSFHQSRAVASYVESIAQMDQAEFEQMWSEADAFNERLRYRSDRFKMSDEELAEYNQILDVTGNGIMGYIQIPKVGIELPVYHGTGEAVLQIAIGHVEGTSLPVGGEGTHAVVSGHRGLPSARLFTDIDQLVSGDTFILQILDRTLTYEVDQIRIVEPWDLSDLEIDPEKDYMTLVTCTPYGVNTHRYLVRGHRIENARAEVAVTADALLVDGRLAAIFIGTAILALMLLLALVFGVAKKVIERTPVQKDKGKKEVKKKVKNEDKEEVRK